MSCFHKLHRWAGEMICFAALLLGVSADASTAQLLDLHDADGPTQLRALIINVRGLSVVSLQGYTARVDLNGEIDGYFTTSGHYTDASCTVGPFWSAGDVIPGFVFRGGALGIAYVPTDAVMQTFTYGQQVFYLSGGVCEAGSVFKTGAYFIVLQNDVAVTGIKDYFLPPLRLHPIKSGDSQCVFRSGFECATQSGKSP